ncbi:MAG TPA: LysR substrate-binding domain-containing protein [Nitrosomonas sp.]|nr:LysR substrate-binding domain-containing protein [Nitrosomonas sp.]
MNLNQIELLRILQETQFNLSKAAERMHIVQSAVSRQLQLFEEELGSPLFERNGKRLIGLTPLGMNVMAEIATIHQAKLNIQSMASDFQDNNKGILHIATTHTQAKYFLPKPIQKFREKHPGIRIYILQASPEQLIDQLHSHKADVAICTEKLNDDDKLVTRHCYEWHHAVIMPLGHPLCEGKLTPERLIDFPILTYSHGFTGRSAIEHAFQHCGLQLDIILAAADTDVIKTYVHCNMGVGIIARMAYDKQVDANLVIRDLSHIIPKSITKIAYLKQNYLPLFTQHFIDELLIAAKDMKA